MAQGNLTAALESYRVALAIRERLAKADPGNVGGQRDLSVSHDRIGDVQVAQGNLAGALESYRVALAISERLAKADLGNAEWQRDLIVTYVKMGEISGEKGYVVRALDVPIDMQQRGMLALRDASMIDDLKRRAAQ